MGYALDGFGIYGWRGEDGHTLSTNELDACHGHVGPIEWDGAEAEMYPYHATPDYPYTLSCFRGTPSFHGTPSSTASPRRRGRR